MKSKIVIPFALYLVGFSMLLAQNVSTKNIRKQPKAFIQISYQDLRGVSLRSALAKSFEKSMLTFGDVGLVERMVVRFILNREETIKSIHLDSAYLRIAESCPPISPVSYKNPYLVALYSIISFVNKTPDPIKAYPEYTIWQTKNLPHAPIGENDPSEGLFGEESYPGLIVQTQNWIANYPSEYILALSIFTHDYSTVNDSISPSEFFIRAVKSLHFISDLEVENGVNKDFLQEEKISSYLIPDTKFMLENTDDFIQQAYESLYLRNPSAEEKSYLRKYIKQTPQLTPQIFYYAMMTAEEYKWY
jgi:hypothetical protein